MSELKIKQIRSTIGRSKDQRATIKGLGLGKIGKVVVKKDCQAIRGMVMKVHHLLEVTVEKA